MNIRTIAPLALCVPLLAAAGPVPSPGQQQPDAAPPPESARAQESWVDTSHSYVANRAQSMTQWMDNFFGDPDYDLEQAESLLRLELSSDWDQQNDFNNKLRLRGKLQLPRISKRLNLLFNDREGDELADDRADRKLDDQVSLLYKIIEQQRSRVDLTLGLGWLKLRPGVRYRNQGPVGDNSSYRFTQRLQHERDDGFYTTSQFNLDRRLGNNKLLRWSSRAVYGEKTEGVEWRTGLSLSQRYHPSRRQHQLVVRYFATVKGTSDPRYTNNYRLGVLLRHRFYRDYLFAELEPSYNLRKNSIDDHRSGVWGVVLRIEMALERDLAKRKTDSK